VNIATYARRNLFRRSGRTILTVIAAMVAVFIFCVIQTFIVAWNSGADDAAVDRIATRHKVSITMQLPKHYIDDLRQVPDIKASTWANWFGAKDPKERVPFFAGFAVDHNTWFDVQDERIKVLGAGLALAAGAPGTVSIGRDGFPVVACSVGGLKLLKLQRAGKSAQSADAFLRGFALGAGTVLAPPAVTLLPR